MEAKKCDDCGAYYEPELRSVYYLIREGVGSFYGLEGHLDLCNECWNRMLKEVFCGLEVKNG